MAKFDEIKGDIKKIVKENKTSIIKYVNVVFILKFIVVAFAAGFLFRALFPPAKPTVKTVVLGEGELEGNPPNQGVGGGQPIEGAAGPGGPEGRVEPAEVQPAAVQVPLPGTGGAVDESMNSLVDQVRPAVVKVIVLPPKKTGMSPNTVDTGIKMGDPYIENQTKAVGSGILISSKGLFLTTKHVVGESNDLQVVLYRAGQKQYTARIIARDPDSPLVIGKIRAPANKQFPFAKMGDSDRLRTGDMIMAMGNPFSLSGTVTSGIVSGKRDVIVEGVRVSSAIVTDASINGGNAGGPLVNMDGEIVGIAFASYVQNSGFTGIGFAVPINFAKEAWNTAL